MQAKTLREGISCRGSRFLVFQIKKGFSAKIKEVYFSDENKRANKFIVCTDAHLLINYSKRLTRHLQSTIIQLLITTAKFIIYSRI